MFPGQADDRSIIHLNVADFAVAVERLLDRRLRDWPVVVAADGASRAAVYDMSEEAFQTGVRKGMMLRRAEKLCRDARVVPPHPRRYERAMAAFLKHTSPYSPLIEAGEDNGHLFLDVSGTSRLFGPPMDVAWRIRKAVRADLELDPIWALAPNKLVAKVATRIVKPVGEYIVEPGEEEEFLRPLPVFLLPGLERDDLRTFREFNIKTIGQAAIWTPGQLSVLFGSRGKKLHQTLRGQDDSPVSPLGKPSPAITREFEFADDTNDQEVVQAALYSLVEKAGFRLRERTMAARRVGVTVEYSDGVRMIRQRTDKSGSSDNHRLESLALTALETAWLRRVRIRRLVLRLDRLVFPPSQLELFPELAEETRASGHLSHALDAIRRRFGESFIGSGRTLTLKSA